MPCSFRIALRSTMDCFRVSSSWRRPDGTSENDAAMFHLRSKKLFADQGRYENHMFIMFHFFFLAVAPSQSGVSHTSVVSKPSKIIKDYQSSSKIIRCSKSPNGFTVAVLGFCRARSSTFLLGLLLAALLWGDLRFFLRACGFDWGLRDHSSLGHEVAELRLKALHDFARVHIASGKLRAVCGYEERETHIKQTLVYYVPWFYIIYVFCITIQRHTHTIHIKTHNPEPSLQSTVDYSWLALGALSSQVRAILVEMDGRFGERFQPTHYIWVCLDAWFDLYIATIL